MAGAKKIYVGYLLGLGIFFWLIYMIQKPSDCETNPTSNALQSYTQGSAYPPDVDAMLNFGWQQIAAPLPANNLKDAAWRIRVFGSYLKNYDSLPEQNSYNAKQPPSADNPYHKMPQLWALENMLFPWAHKKFPSIYEMSKTFVGRAIVVTTGEFHFRFAVHFIKSVRLLGSQLPIVVVYAGGIGLSMQQRTFFEDELDVTTLDIDRYINDQSLNNMAIKEFAALVVPYQEVLVCDADVTFVQNPDLIFEDEGYRREHALFFHDRTVFPGLVGKKNWLSEHIPKPWSKNLLNTRMFRSLTEHEQDSGVVLINKKERLAGLLSACRLVSKDIREFFYKEFYSEKESWWIGFELAGESWTDLNNNTGSGVYGEVRHQNGKTEVCGHMAHFDRDDNPLWINGAFRQDSNYKKFSHVSYDGEWDFGPRCTGARVTALNSDQLEIIDGISKLWLADPLIHNHHLDPNIYRYLNLKKKHKQKLRKLKKRKRKVIKTEKIEE